MKKFLIILSAFLFLSFLFINRQKFLPKQESYAPPISVDNQLLTVTREYVRKNSVAGLIFDLHLQKQVDRWALVEVVPEDTDRAAVILEKVDGQWIPRAFGTIFPEWEEKVPELFQP